MKSTSRSLRVLVAILTFTLLCGQFPAGANQGAVSPNPRAGIGDVLYRAAVGPVLSWWHAGDGESGERATLDEPEVDRVWLCPAAITMYAGEDRVIAPVPFDANNTILDGVTFTWESDAPGVASVDGSGIVTAVSPGGAAILIQAGTAKATLEITVAEGVRPEFTDEQAAGQGDPCSVGIGGEVDECDIQPAPLENEPVVSDDIIAARNAVGNPRFFARETLPAGETGLVGNTLGSSSYQFAAPVASVGGREIGVNLALVYNSQIWSRDPNPTNNRIIYDYDQGWPAAGWRLGYGRIIRNYLGSSSNHHLLILPDGTRVAMTPVSGQQWTHEAADGGNIRLKDLTLSTPSQSRMLVFFPDGTKMTFDKDEVLTNNRWLPTRVQGPNGNFIAIEYERYKPTCFPHLHAIKQIRDTQNRVYSFHYETADLFSAEGASPEVQIEVRGLLKRIEGPRPGGGRQTLVEIQHGFIYLHPKFNTSQIGAVVGAANNEPVAVPVVRRIAYPATGRGFLFSGFSDYGMPRKISARRGMNAYDENLQNPLYVSDGVEVASTTYAFNDVDPVSGQTLTLSDAPQFSKRTEVIYESDEQGAPSTVSVYTYSRMAPDGEPTSTTVTPPTGGAAMETNLDGSGRVDTIRYLDGATELRKIDYQYTSNQMTEVRTRDQGAWSKVVYEYGTHNRLMKVREYDIGETNLIRTTEHSYVDGTASDPSAYVNRNLPYLVGQTLVKNGAGDIKAKTAYEYDNYGGGGNPDLKDYSLTVAVQGHDLTSFGKNEKIRGNVTKTTSWYGQGANDFISRAVKYDVFGNIVEAEVSCCQVQSFTFNSTQFYAAPVSVRQGATTGASLLTSFLYDSNTGLVTQVTSPSGQTTKYSYDGAWRLVQETFSRTGSTATDVSRVVKYTEDQTAPVNDYMTVSQSVSYKEDYASALNKTITTSTWVDGAGRILRRGTSQGGLYDMTAAKYDALGRVIYQSNPYSAGGVNPDWNTVKKTEFIYDKLSRTTEVRRPDYVEVSGVGKNAVKTAYGADGSRRTVTVTDEVGRQRKVAYDGIGRLREVYEDAAGANLQTSYGYDVLGNLTEVNQGGQIREYAYDWLSRLTYELTPEQRASQFIVHDQRNWSARYVYNDHDLVMVEDARGVETHYLHDELNRLKRLWFTGRGGSLVDPNASRPALPSNVEATSDVVVEYFTGGEPNYSLQKNGQVEYVEHGVAREDYDYDSFSRVSAITNTVNGKTFTPLQYEYTSAGQSRKTVYPREGTASNQSPKRLMMEHDTRGRLSALKNVNGSGSTLATYLSGAAYQPGTSFLTGFNLGNGTTESYTYATDRLQMTQQKVSRTTGGQVLMQMDYDYNARDANGAVIGNAGQVSQVDTIIGPLSGVTEKYTYDALGRLSTAQKTSAQSREGKVDTVGIYNTGIGSWQQRNTHTNGPADNTFYFGVGGAGYIAMTGDWNHDNVDTPGLYHPSSSVFLQNENESGAADATFFFGATGQNYIPLSGDWNGDGIDTVGLYDPDNGAVYLRNSNSNGPADISFFFGPGDSDPNAFPKWTPITGDWDGDGIDTIGLYLQDDDPATSVFYLRNSNSNGGAEVTVNFGGFDSNFRPVAGDWDGNGIDTIGLYRANDGAWFLRNSNTDGAADLTYFFGGGEAPIKGDWDGLPVAGANWTRKYTYDRWGNRTETRDAADQLVQQMTTEKVGVTQVPTNRIATVADVGQPVQYVYDDAGNLTWDGVNTYAYDAANRMTRVYAGQTPSPQTELARYVYDAANRRVMQEAGGQVRVTLWDGMHSISEFTGVSASAAVLSTVYIYAGNRMIANEIDGILQYTHPDRLSVRMTTDGSSPNYVGQQWHYPFGEEETVSGSVDKHQFTNYERDEASGTDYAMNRQYGNGLGRFMQVDPMRGSIGAPQSLNRYSYTIGDPINKVDPLGLFCVDRYYFDANGESWTVTECYLENSPNNQQGGHDPDSPVHQQQYGVLSAERYRRDPCAHLLPTVLPTHADLEENIRLAQLVQRSIYSERRTRGASGAYVLFDWFRNQVQSRGPWDYKRIHSSFEDFGNFNYGATGSAAGINPSVLLRAAGWTQQKSGASAAGQGEAPESLTQVLAGVGGVEPFGDDPKDHEWIKKGIEYFRCRQANPIP